MQSVLSIFENYKAPLTNFMIYHDNNVYLERKYDL